MKTIKVTIFETSTADDTASTLSSILESSSDFGFRVEQERLTPAEFEGGAGETCDPVRSPLPCVGFLILSTSFPPARACELLGELKRRTPQMVVLIILVGDTPGHALKLLKGGAADFVTAPLRRIDILARLWRLLRRDEEEPEPVRSGQEYPGVGYIIGESPKFRAEVRKISLLANTDDSVLIAGETGTGKELYARAIHHLGRRAPKPFVPVNCGSIPHELIENELFGHERGAFTGAFSSRRGLIHEANEGTLFLDELDGLPPHAQFKLLRFLQEKEYRPLGSTKILKADVRVVAATNANPEEAVRDGRLRADLYYRLNVLPINLPPLRERREDVLRLARHFLLRLARGSGRDVPDLSVDAIQKLLFYDWPGNVRELENVLRRAFVLSEGALIHGADVVLTQDERAAPRESFQKVKSRVVAEFEKNYIEELLSTYNGNVSRAAAAAKKNRRALWQLIRKHHIDPEHFRSLG